jgi:hypothetical protein
MPEGFWALVELLEQRGDDDYTWVSLLQDPLIAITTGRPVFQQVAVALLRSGIGWWFTGENPNDIKYWKRDNPVLLLAHSESPRHHVS